LGTQQRGAIVATLFGSRASTGISILIDKGTKSVRAFRKQLEDSAGSAKKMASIMRDTLHGRLLSLSSAIESVKLSIFALNDKGLEKTVDNMTKWVRINQKAIAQKVGHFLHQFLDNLPDIWKWLKRIIIGVVIFKTLAAAIKVAEVAMAAFNLVTETNPIVLIGSAVALVIVGLVELSKHWRGFTKLLEGTPAPIKAIGFVLLALGSLFRLVAKLAILAWTPIKVFFEILGKIIKFAFEFAFEPIKFFIGLAHVTLSAWSKVAGFFKSFWKSNTKAIDKQNGSVKRLTATVGSAKIKPVAPVGSSDTAGAFTVQNKAQAESEREHPVFKPQMISPHERISKTISEKNSTSKAEVTIKDETGRASVTKGSFAKTGLVLQHSGSF
jgi:hypothetical protein